MDVVAALILILWLGTFWLRESTDRYGWWALALLASLVPLSPTGGAIPQAVLAAAVLIRGGAWLAAAAGWALSADIVAMILGGSAVLAGIVWWLAIPVPLWVLLGVLVLFDGVALYLGSRSRLHRWFLAMLGVFLLADGLELVNALNGQIVPAWVLMAGHALALGGLALSSQLVELQSRQRIVDRLSSSEEHFRMIFEHSGVAMALLTPQGGFIRVNPALVQLFGYQPEELRGRHLIDLCRSENIRASRTEQGVDLPQGLYERERHFHHKLGHELIARVIRVPLRDANGLVQLIVAVVLDVTERTRAEQALAASEARYRQRFERALDGLFTCTPSGQLLDVNPSFSRLLGAVPDRAEPVALTQLVEDASSLHKHLRQTVETGSDRCELRLRTASGTYREVEIASSVLEQDRNPVIYVNVRDIHERKQAEQALRKAEEELRRERDFWSRVVDTSPALILVLNTQGQLLRANHATWQMFRTDGPLPEGTPLHQLCPEALAVVLARELQRLASEGQPIAFEALLPSKKGDRWLAWRAALTADNARNSDLFVLAAVDVTEQRRLEEQLRHAQKMECLGTLVGGIAHDFNNQLAVVLGNLDLLIREYGGQSVRRELVDAERAARRCADMTRALLAFSRRQVIQLQPLAPGQLLEELVPLLQRLLPATIQVDLDSAPGLWIVEADATQMHQVLVNLAVNARDAMPRGGRLRIALENRDISAETAEKHPGMRAGRHVVLRVQDSGQGMTAEVRERIFEPFFTTKEVGKGTGLGLPVVFGIVQQHRGWITLESEPGQGTTFEIGLPTIDPLPLLTSRKEAEAPHGQGETILVVDDEPMLCTLASTVLGLKGYRVLTSTRPEEALRLVESHAGEIVLVILDLMMPGMTGLEMLPLLRRHIPQVRVLFTSGTGDRDTLLKAGADAYLPKPYGPGDLAERVRELLQRAKSSC